MFLPRIILSSLLIFITALSAHAQKPAASDWSIADYFKNLPEKYVTTEGDFAKPSAETLVVDEKNGYVAQMDSPPGGNFEPFPVFEMALFKSQTKPPLLVVSNMKNDHVCSIYETFFLVQIDRKWAEVKRDVLPRLDLKMFWDNPQSVERLLKIIKETAISYHFQPPRKGTRMKVKLEICDYLGDDAPNAEGEELGKIINSAKTISLEWDKQNGKFILAK